MIPVFSIGEISLNRRSTDNILATLKPYEISCTNNPAAGRPSSPLPSPSPGQFTHLLRRYAVDSRRESAPSGSHHRSGTAGPGSGRSGQTHAARTGAPRAGCRGRRGRPDRPSRRRRSTRTSRGPPWCRPGASTADPAAPAWPSAPHSATHARPAGSGWGRHVWL